LRTARTVRGFRRLHLDAQPPARPADHWRHARDATPAPLNDARPPIKENDDDEDDCTPGVGRRTLRARATRLICRRTLRRAHPCFFAFCLTSQR